MNRILRVIAISVITFLIHPPVSAFSTENSASETPKPETGLEVNVPHPKLMREISVGGLSHRSSIAKLTFSPNGRYLGIVDNVNVSASAVRIWDLTLNKEITYIQTSFEYGSFLNEELLWSPDGNVITFGSGGPDRTILFWDPFSGLIIHKISSDKPVLWSRYNEDGRKLLVFIMNKTERAYRIYDTNTWNFDEYGNDFLRISSLSWARGDKILVAGVVAKKNEGKTIDGKTPKERDVLLRLVDPSGESSSRSALFPSSIASGQYNIKLYAFGSMMVNYRRNKISLDVNNIIDVDNLTVFQCINDADILSERVPSAGAVFSADARYLYLLGRRAHDNQKSAILDVDTGQVVGEFPGGTLGIAASQDGKLLAVGDEEIVRIYEVR